MALLWLRFCIDALGDYAYALPLARDVQRNLLECDVRGPPAEVTEDAEASSAEAVESWLAAARGEAGALVRDAAVACTSSPSSAAARRGARQDAAHEAAVVATRRRARIESATTESHGTFVTISGP